MPGHHRTAAVELCRIFGLAPGFEEAKMACNQAALASCEVTSELEGRLDPERWEP